MTTGSAWLWILLYLFLFVLVIGEPWPLKPWTRRRVGLSVGPYDLLYVHHPLHTLECPTEERVRQRYPLARTIWIVRDPSVDIYSYVSLTHPRVVLLYANSTDPVCPLDRPVPPYHELFVQDRPVWNFPDRSWCIPLTRIISERWLFYESLHPGHRFVDLWYRPVFYEGLADWILHLGRPPIVHPSPTFHPTFHPTFNPTFHPTTIHLSASPHEVLDDGQIWILPAGRCIVRPNKQCIQIRSDSPLLLSYIQRWTSNIPSEQIKLVKHNSFPMDSTAERRIRNLLDL